MNELTIALGMMPDLNTAVAVTTGLSYLGGLWLAGSAIVYLALIPLARRRRTETPEAPAVQWEAELPKAA